MFDIKPAENNPADAVLFSASDAVVKLKQGNTGNLGFSRDGYYFSFHYKVPENKWTTIAIASNNKGTSLFVNGELIEKLEGKVKTFKELPDDPPMPVFQTLFFPLKNIGCAVNAFKGMVKNVKVYNYILAKEGTIE